MLVSLLFVVCLHFVADFIFQTDTMAVNKSTSVKWLTAHVLVYMLPFFLLGWQFAVINGAAHWLTDFVTSRVTSYLWKKGDRHNFFVVIGLDQAVHMTTLILSLVVLKW